MYRNYRHWGSNHGCGYKCDDNECYEDLCSCMQSYEDSYEECECGFGEPNGYFPANPMLAQSYVPIQQINKTFKPCIGLKMGTIYPELVSPYMPGQSQAEIDFIRAKNKIGEGCNQC